MIIRQARVRFVVAALFLVYGYAQAAQVEAQLPNLRPQAGYVPDAVTASKIADAVLVSMFGEEYVKEERPFSIVLKDGVWVIRGKTSDDPHPGGSVEIQIDKGTACVVSVTRGK